MEGVLGDTGTGAHSLRLPELAVCVLRGVSGGWGFLAGLLTLAVH